MYNICFRIGGILCCEGYMLDFILYKCICKFLLKVNIYSLKYWYNRK